LKPRRIVHLTSVHSADDIRIFHKECRSLVQAGYNVILVAPHKSNEVVEGVQVVAVRKAERRLRRMTATVIQVYRKALKLRASIYHFHDPELIPIGLLLNACGRRVVYDIHEDTPRDLVAREYLPPCAKMLVVWFIELLENLATRRLSGVVAATPAIGARFQALNPRTVVVNNYPIFGELAPRHPVNWEKRAQAVAYVGCIALERGVVEMVRAMEYVPQELGAALELAGAFSPPGHREFVQDKSGWRHVREHGVVSRVEVARLLSRVRAGLVLFHPEPNHVQSQPNKLFEYMSAGIPVIASDFPLWREIVEQANCGLLVDPLNPRAIARAIEYVLTHPGEAEAMGRRGRETAAKQYTWDSESEKLIRLYNQLLSTRG